MLTHSRLIVLVLLGCLEVIRLVRAILRSILWHPDLCLVPLVLFLDNHSRIETRFQQTLHPHPQRSWVRRTKCSSNRSFLSPFASPLPCILPTLFHFPNSSLQIVRTFQTLGVSY